MSGAPETFIHSLKVLLDPTKAQGLDMHLRWEVAGEITTGIRIRNCIAVPTNGDNSDARVSLSHHALANLFSGRISLKEGVEEKEIVIDGDTEKVFGALACFDLPSFGG